VPAHPLALDTVFERATIERVRKASLLGVTLAVLALALTTGTRAQTGLRTRAHASGFTSPVAFVQDPTDASVQFVVEQAGRIRAVRNGTVLTTDFLTLTSSVGSGGERGLLGLAFAPDYETSGRFFVNFTNTSGHTVVARFRRLSNPLVADPGSRFDLRLGPDGEGVIAQPFSNHNGGHLAFGPDGYLYVGLGDGGFANDPDHRAQNPAELLGKMLRIDVSVPDSQTQGYVVPTDNPFRSASGTRPEIWSFGWRNPWRFSFDDTSRGGTGALLVGDVGQGRWEEIDYEPRGRGGRNYGWRNREGAHDNVTTRPPAFLPLLDPVHEYDHTVGQSITGGYVYRGSALGAAFRGRYFFADFVASRVWSIALAVDSATGEATASDRREHTAELGGSSALGGVSSFGVDGSGELYIVSYSGSILKIVGTTAPPSAPTGVRIIR
jgi:glucose/arabinose dehydrogenase